DPGAGLELNAVLADAVKSRTALGRIGAVDHLRIDADHDRVEDVATGEVDGGGNAPGQIEAGLVTGDNPRDRFLQLGAGQDRLFGVRRRNLDAGLPQGDLLPHDHGVIDVQQLHADHVEDANLGTRQEALNPQLHEAEEDQQKDDEQEQANG